MKNTALPLLAAVSVALFAGCSSPTGESVDASESSIVGGIEATPGSWDGAVIVQKSGRLVCGGTLISDRWVLTAAHCVTASSPTGGFSGVVIGRHKQSATTEGVVIGVEKAFRHASYGTPSRYDNDIALIQLKEAAPKTASRAKLIKPENLDKIVAGAMTTVVGWGTTSSGGSISDVLRQVDVPIIDNATCKAQSGYSSVTDTMLCAGNLEAGGVDSCQGDSGGPIYIKVGDSYEQIGLVSWGIGCAGRRQPGVYARLGNFLNWVFEKTEGAAGVDPTPPAKPEPTPEPTPAPGEGEGEGESGSEG